MSSLHDEIRIDILSRLPVKSLLRFKSVCKPWCRIFCDPDFAKMHTDNAIRNGTSNFLMFHYYMPTRITRNAFYSVDYTSLSSTSSSLSRGNPLHDSTEMDYPVVPPNDLKLLGSCRGLLCFRTNDPADEDSICLWNPSTRKSKMLPDSPNHFISSCDGMYIGVCGLGYDDKSNDFKVVRVAEIDSSVDNFDGSPDWSEAKVYTIRPDSDQTEVSSIRSRSVFEIYSLRTNAWKKCQTMPYYFPGELKSGVVVNGALHWWGIHRIDGHEAIISFDFSDEVFKEVAILEGPMLHNEEVSDTEYENNNVAVLGGCLCLLHKTFDQVDVWVMQEYGVKESWMKRFTITEESIVETSSLRVICDFQNGAILFSTDDSLVYYDPNCETGARKSRILGTDGLMGAEMCVPSLVSLNSGT